MTSYSTKSVQYQSAFGSSGPPPMYINDATHVSSSFIPSNTSDTFHMSTSTNIAYLITTDERRAFISEIKALKPAVYKTTITTIGCPNRSIVPINIGISTWQLETAQRKYGLVSSKM
ncbi:hypothetical protein [Parasitella parasitica]|uniref:Uncharacterized protein n=1 Tax=Parasitella parasitica TaxID=35722 RepID=A0A0B7N2Z8_9FUNG|nr:hypothetical protein [Parasitella parasitica]